jgi:lauroyl/myristoyl acyltransferase
VYIARLFTISNRQKFAFTLGMTCYGIFVTFRFLFTKRYNIFVKNIAIVMETQPSYAEIHSNLKDYFYYASLLFLESFSLNKNDITWLKKNIIFENKGLQAILNAYKNDEKIIIASIHIGNWELTHRYLTDVCHVNVALVYRKQNNQKFEKLIKNSRTNAETIDKSHKGALKKISKALENKKIIMVLLDQRDNLSGEDIIVCGQKAMLPTALIKYAMKHQCSIFSGISYHKKNNIHIEIQNSFSTKDFQNKKASELMQQMFDSFSIAIKRYPTQWYCLMHDLWRK